MSENRPSFREQLQTKWDEGKFLCVGLAPDMPFLIPGIGTQGGDLEKTLKYAPDSNGQGMIINSGSAIIYASSGEDFAEAARFKALELHEQIQALRAT